jgi:hypothetical protein
MGAVAASLATMGMGQLLLAIVFVGCYALLLGQFWGTRGSSMAIVIACAAAAGFVTSSDPWEAGAIFLACVPVGMGVFAGVAWTLWNATSKSGEVRVVATSTQPASWRISSNSLWERSRARLRLHLNRRGREPPTA